MRHRSYYSHSMDNSDRIFCHSGAYLLLDKIEKQRILRLGKRDVQFSCGIRENFLNEALADEKEL